jgi:hypothetical protein
MDFESVVGAVGEQYVPPAELAGLHIHSAVTRRLQHKPAQGKIALDCMLAQGFEHIRETRSRIGCEGYVNKV